MSTPWANGEWRRVAVYGLGLSGRAAADLLRRRSVEVVGLDDESLDLEVLGTLGSDPGLELHLGTVPARLPAGVDGLVLSPGVPPDRPLVVDARRRGVPVIAEVELAYPLLNGPMVGITGSNGKSTTTALTGALLTGSGLAAEVCGNIGRPLSACVEGEPGRIFVVELSSFQLEAVHTVRPRAAALLNLSPDHLDRYRGLAAYGEAKARLFAFQQAEDTAVVNADDPLVAALAAKARRRFFSLSGPVEDGCYLAGEEVVEAGEGPDRPLFALTDLPLPGPHNVENAMAATLLALAVGARRETVAASLAGFRGLPHRLALVRERSGVRYYDDSKGTNPGATMRALAGFPDGRIHLILGGRNKGADFAELAALVGRKARRVYLVGEASAELGERLEGLAPYSRCGDLDRAVESAAAAARPGETVLLSPACASFDQYSSFTDRGEHFQRLVEALGEAVDG